MLSYYITSVTGWLMVVLLIAIIAYPFLLRGGLLGPVQPFLKRMRFHYWLGYSTVAIVLIHAVIPMSAGLANRTDATGLDIATLALFVLFGQAFVGFQLREPQLSIRRVMRRWHFWLMISLVTLVLGHVILNSPFIQQLIQYI